MEEGMERDMEKGSEEGIAKKSYQVVVNLLETKKFTIAEITNFPGGQ